MQALAHGTSAASPWAWAPNFVVWVPMLALLAGYFYLLRRYGPRKAPPGRPFASTLQKTCWVLGVVVLWVGADWPIDRLSDDYLLSVHMLQHMLFSFVAAPLLLLGLPVWLLRMFIRGPKLEKVVRFATRPLVALVVFNAMIAFQHWPAIVNLAVANETFHLGLHVVLVASSLLMWWPVVEPLPEMRRLSEPGKMLYLFLQSIVPTVPASFLTFASRPIYSAYAAASHPWMSAVTDQRVAGLLMKIGGGLLLWTVIAVIFFRWNAREESGEVPEVAWEDFERELEVWDLRT